MFAVSSLAGLSAGVCDRRDAGAAVLAAVPDTNGGPHVVCQ